MTNKCKTGRMPPLTPDVVEKKLKEEMIFTNDSDVGRVAKLYKSFFDAVTSTHANSVVLGLAQSSMVLLLHSGLAAGSTKHARLSLCFPSIFCLLVLPSSIASSPRCPSLCQLPGGLLQSLPLNNKAFVHKICFLLTHVDGATRHIFSIPGMFQCTLVPLLSAKCFFFRRMITGQAKQRDHEMHRAQLA